MSRRAAFWIFLVGTLSSSLLFLYLTRKSPDAALSGDGL